MPPAFDSDAGSPREQIVALIQSVLDAFAELGIEVEGGAQESLGALETELDETDDDELGDDRLEAISEQVQVLACEAFVEAAALLPAPAASGDGETAAARDVFEDAVGGAVSSEDAMRLMDRAESPSAVIQLLMAAVSIESEDDANDVLQAVMNLWNHAPRTELAGATPTQAMERARGGEGARRSGGARGSDSGARGSSRGGRGGGPRSAPGPRQRR